MQCTTTIIGDTEATTVAMTTLADTITDMGMVVPVTMDTHRAVDTIGAEDSVEGDAVVAAQVDAAGITVEGACTNVHITRDRIEILRHQCSGRAGEMFMARAAAQVACRCARCAPRHGHVQTHAR